APGMSFGWEVARVHKRTESGSGSPEATPCWNTACPPASTVPCAASWAEALKRPASPETPNRAAPAAPALSTVRRVGVGAAAGERPSKSVMRHMTLGQYLYRQSVVPRSHPIEGVF